MLKIWKIIADLFYMESITGDEMCSKLNTFAIGDQ